jgi:phosphate transport system substrate-binding protein
MAAELDYVAMPTAVVKLVEGVWKVQMKDASGNSL